MQTYIDTLPLYAACPKKRYSVPVYRVDATSLEDALDSLLRANTAFALRIGAGRAHLSKHLVIQGVDVILVGENSTDSIDNESGEPTIWDLGSHHIFVNRAHVCFENLRLQSGWSDNGGNGGAITAPGNETSIEAANATTIRMRRCNIERCISNNDGGAMFAGAATLVLEDCMFVANRAGVAAGTAMHRAAGIGGTGPLAVNSLLPDCMHAATSVLHYSPLWLCLAFYFGS